MSFNIERIALFVSILAFAVFGAAAYMFFDQPSGGASEKLSRQQISAIIAQNQSDLTHHAGDPVLGNPDGDVTLVEFFDYKCTYCKIIHPAVMDVVREDGNIRYVAKELPILGPVSTFAAQAALAAQKQGLYAKFSTALMAAKSLQKETVFTIATQVGLDAERLRTDMVTFEHEINQTLDINFALAKALKIKGTPAFIAGDILVPGAPSPSDLKRLISLARKNAVLN